MHTLLDKKNIVIDLVKKFKQNKKEYKDSSYNETQLRNDFINPFLTALGWDVNNIKGVAQHHREVIQEDTVDVEENGLITKKKPDYAFNVNGKRKFFLEVKKPYIDIEKKLDPAFQIRRYGWNARLPISILTNFEQFVIYDCRYRPEFGEETTKARLKIYQFEEYVDKFEEIYNNFSANAVFSGEFDEEFTMAEERSGTEPFDRYFLKQIEGWRLLLAKDLVKNNNDLKQGEINFLIQRLINRVVFLRICEDRELEKYKGLLNVKNYEDLKKLFQKADNRYNSGLFDFLEDELTLKIHLDDELIIQLFRELYYPESPYDFSVVESEVLGEIYELFLAREVKLTEEKNIEVIEKPEVVESNGVVTTPQFIVDSIIEKTLIPMCKDKTLEELSTLRIVDIACGSGVFLLAAYDYLLKFHLEWYLKNEPENYPERITNDYNDNWKLTLYEKQRILVNNIYGVDIDIQAVEVARFSLLLRVLEDESIADINSQIIRYDIPVLPKLNSNIKCGNSLVDYSYFNFSSVDVDTQSQLININPFDWTTEFEDVFSEGGFDLIIGNPPYIRIQNMVKYSPLEHAYYRSDISGYKCANSSNFDKYILFIERSLSLIKNEGFIGVIVPHKFFTLKSGAQLRKIISRGKYLSEIVHFGVEQIFKGKLTYTAIIKLTKSENNYFTVQHVTNVTEWIRGNKASVESFPSTEISEEPWMFIHPEVKKLFNRIKANIDKTIKDVADVFVGIQTSKDLIYIIHPDNENEKFISFTDKDGVQRIIERDITRPIFHDVKFKAFGTPKFNAYVIYPYKGFSNRSAILYTPLEMETKFPNCWEYLKNYKKELLKRSVNPPFTEENWYKYGRSQSLQKFNGEPKLVWTVLSLEPRYVYDNEDIVFSGGGNGPYYGLRIKPGNQHSLLYLQAILCHPVIEAIIKTGVTSKFQGGYYSHGKQFVDVLPFREINFDDSKDVQTYNEIVNLVEQLGAISKDNRIDPHTRDNIQRTHEGLKRIIDNKINNLYGFSEADLLLIKELT